MVPRLLAPVQAMRSCTCTDVIQPCPASNHGPNVDSYILGL